MTLSLEKSRPKVFQAIVDCYTKNTYFMEFKMFLIMEYNKHKHFFLIMEVFK